MSAAIGVAKKIGLKNKKINAGVKTFSGIKRRFEIHKGKSGLIYIDDYAHHPKELKAAINAAKKLWPGKKVTVIFQPHLFSRTNDFMNEFAEELAKVDELILMEIYPARELPMKGVNSSALLEKINLKNKRIVQKRNLINDLKKDQLEVLMTLGAGDIDVFAPRIREWINTYDK
jgi:UDP-N-acetylmuramate--alanine ligase